MARREQLAIHLLTITGADLFEEITRLELKNGQKLTRDEREWVMDKVIDDITSDRVTFLWDEARWKALKELQGMAADYMTELEPIDY